MYGGEFHTWANFAFLFLVSILYTQTLEDNEFVCVMGCKEVLIEHNKKIKKVSRNYKFIITKY